MKGKTMDSEVGANDVFTAAQISQLAARAGNDVGAADAALTNAERQYDRLTQKYNFTTPEAHAASFKEHAPIREQAEDAALKVARAHEAQLGRILTQLQNSDRTNITDAELEKANLRAAFVKEDVDRASIPQLHSMVKRAIQTGDRSEQFLVARYVRDRLRNPKSRDALEDGAGILNMLLQIEEGLRDRSMDRYRALAAEAFTKAQDLRRRAVARPRELRPFKDPKTGETKIPWPRDVNF